MLNGEIRKPGVESSLSSCLPGGLQTSVSPLLKWVVVNAAQDTHPRGHSDSLCCPLPSSALLTPENPCKDVQCALWHHCQVVDGAAKCVKFPLATCHAQGDPHYTTFDGRRYDMMGTCSYTMVELCSDDESLPAFSVEAKNEHRGSRLVSYIGLVTVRAYSHSVSLARGEAGFARVNIQGFGA